jgi:hypothetical protein
LETEEARFVAEHNAWAHKRGARRLWQDPLIRPVKPKKPKTGKFPHHELTPEQREELRSKHVGLCEICGIKPVCKLSIDHCHATGKLRGLLCSKCNSILGFCGDNKATLIAAVAYLEKYTL